MARSASFRIHFLIAGIWLVFPRPAIERPANLSGLAPRRTTEAWLPGLPFGECPLARGPIGLKAECPRPDAAEFRELTRAGLELRGAGADGAREPRSRTAILSALLTASSPEDFAFCLGQLERRAREESVRGPRASAEAATDLAAAYLLRAEALGDANDWLSAAEAAQAALDLERDYPPALFDLALAYERLLLRRAAIGTWSRLLRAEAGGGWAEEAEAHLAQLQDELAAGPAAEERPADLQAEREAALERLLPLWARDPRAAAAGGELERLFAPAARRSREAGDGFLAALLEELRQGGGRAAAVRRYLDRQQELEGEGDGACAPGLSALTAELGGPASALGLLALRLEATCAYQLSDFAAAEQAAALWQETAATAGYLAAEGRAAWFRGTVASARGSFAAAQRFYREASASFAGCGEARNLANVDLLLANAKALAGDPAGAWRLMHSALRRVAARGAAREASIAMQAAALQLGLSGRSRLGLVYGGELLQSDLAAGEIAGRCDARWLRCWLLHKSGQQEEAERELGHLRGEIARAADPKKRRRFELMLLSAESELFLERDPPRSARSAAAALAASEELSFDPSALDLHLHLGQALARSGDAAGALAALDRGLRYFAAQARENPEIPAKVRLFDRAGKMLEEKMQLELRQGNLEAAFATLEAGRAHLLLDEMAARPADLATIQQSLAARDLLVQYVFLEEKALAFRVGRKSLALVELAGDRQSLKQTIDSWWLAAGDGETRLAEELHQRLLRPLELSPGERLLISFPDELAALPWAALRNPATGRRLVEEHQLLTVPSASAMLAIERRGRGFSSFAGPALLAAGDPAFDGAAAPGLARTLPGARDEARAAAAAFADDPLLLEREEATGSAFIAAMAGRPLVLYAGHAVADSAEPLATRLFFAPDASFPTGELTAGDFYRRQLPSGALVVLSGCETGGGYASRVEGRLDLAHPFLASGAAQVILTRRPVMDRAAQKFLSLFFERLRATGNPWESFRDAQLAAIATDEKGHRELPTWAIYQLVGGRWPETGGGAS